MADIKALAVIDTNKQVILPPQKDLEAIFTELADMDRIYYGRVKIAQGGTNVFTVQEPAASDDETTVVKTVDAVVIMSHKVNGYWPGAYGEDKIPACASMDGENGVDRASGEIIRCVTCPFNQYGTAVDSKGNKARGKACKNMRRLYLIRPGDALPLILTLPPTSISTYDKYRQQLLLARKPYYALLTRFGLEKTANPDGTPYSRLTFTPLGVLPVEEAERIKVYAEGIKNSATRAGVTADDYEAAEEGEKKHVEVGAHDLETATREKQQGVDFAKLRQQQAAEIAAKQAADGAIQADGFVKVDEDELPFTEVPNGEPSA